ncbi:MAG: cupin domain-containing protein [Candidatus Odinarchaeota archaeon]
MIKENPKYVEKLWGEEIWLVNNDKYCGKLLIVNRNARCSVHSHPKKQETFKAIEGFALLTINGKEYMLAPFTRPKTILPGEVHSFYGITECVILEISTHHDDEDVIRYTKSEPGKLDSE